MFILCFGVVPHKKHRKALHIHPCPARFPPPKKKTPSVRHSSDDLSGVIFVHDSEMMQPFFLAKVETPGFGKDYYP